MSDAALSARVLLLREHLLAQADPDAAVAACNELEAAVHARFNAMTHLGAGSSILARAMLSRAIAQVAGAWLADLVGLPEPDGHAIVATLVSNGVEGIRETMLNQDGLDG